MFNQISKALNDALVRSQIDRFIAEGQVFTSHQVTEALRARNADILVIRWQVYLAVVEYTNELIADGKLTRETRDYGLRPAYTYVPVLDAGEDNEDFDAVLDDLRQTFANELFGFKQENLPSILRMR